MLADDPWAGETPLCNVVLGGTEIGDDIGYGPARYITAEDVKAVASALDGITPDQLAKRYDSASLQKNEVYPGIWEEDDAVDYLTSWYGRLRDYYLDAAAKGNAMLKYLN